MDHILGQDRDQIQFISLEQLVGAQSFVRIIDAFIDALDLSKLGFTYYELNKEGRPPFHPRTMMKLFLYGYHNQIRSFRKLEKACTTNIEVMWLIENRRPHYKTIANFRKDNSKAFREVFRRFIFILKDWKLIEGKTIAIDSFKIRAQNSLKNNYNDRKLKRHLDYIENKINEYETELDKGIGSEWKQELKDKISYNKDKKESYQKIKEQLDERKDGQISLTYADLEAVIFQRNSVKVGYNIQAASDAQHKMLIAMDTGDVNDTKALSVMVDKVSENIDQDQFDVIADKGYHSGRELKHCQDKGIQTYVSPKESSSTKKNPDYAVTAFKYNKEKDVYICPQGEILESNGNWYNKKLLNGRKSYKVKHYKTKSCTECPVMQMCTKSSRGRYIESLPCA